MADPSRVNSRRAQMLVTVREMVLRGEFTSRRAIEEVDLSKALGASRPIVPRRWKNCARKVCWRNLPGRLRASCFQRSGHLGCHRGARRARKSAAGLAARRGSIRCSSTGAPHQCRVVEATASYSTTESPTADQMARFGELNLAFHKALIELAKSPMLQLSLDRVQSIAFASPSAVVTPGEPGGFAQAIREHEAILDAIKTGNAVRAEALVREHARLALRGVKNAIERPGSAVKAAANSASTGKSTPHRTHKAETAGPTSQLVLDAAAALFCEKGFSETTTREIAARLNIHQASLYYHISGKEELLYRISRLALEAVERQVGAALQTPGNPRDRLNSFFRGHLQGLFENHGSGACLDQRIQVALRRSSRELGRAARNYPNCSTANSHPL